MNTKESYFNTHQWPFYSLLFAGVYNLVWGSVVVLFPTLFFDMMNYPVPKYLSIWQCVGMIVGVYGIGYLISAFNPSQHWVVVLVGLLGKIFGPIGFVYHLYQGTFPIQFGWVILGNDLIWWIPFGLILFFVFKEKDHA